MFDLNKRAHNKRILRSEFEVDFQLTMQLLVDFFSLHFILPFIILIIVSIRLYFLHITGSINPLGTNRDLNKISPNFYFIIKDFVIKLTFT